jgi:hypothetical protein
MEMSGGEFGKQLQFNGAARKPQQMQSRYLKLKKQDFPAHHYVYGTFTYKYGHYRTLKQTGSQKYVTYTRIEGNMSDLNVRNTKSWS